MFELLDKYAIPLLRFYSVVTVGIFLWSSIQLAIHKTPGLWISALLTLLGLVLLVWSITPWLL